MDKEVYKLMGFIALLISIFIMFYAFFFSKYHETSLLYLSLTFLHGSNLCREKAK
jgi:hypothetical protein